MFFFHLVVFKYDRDRGASHLIIVGRLFAADDGNGLGVGARWSTEDRLNFRFRHVLRNAVEIDLSESWRRHRWRRVRGGGRRGCFGHRGTVRRCSHRGGAFSRFAGTQESYPHEERNNFFHRSDVNLKSGTPSPKHGDDRENHEDQAKNLGDFRGQARHAPKAKKSRQDGDEEESNGVSEHAHLFAVIGPTFAIGDFYLSRLRRLVTSRLKSPSRHRATCISRGYKFARCEKIRYSAERNFGRASIGF